MPRETYRDPIFNLKAVVEATGVTADALRAWERRYGLPEPARTEGGHRVYSRRDIDIVKWLVARQEESLRIGRAVKLWRTLQEEGQDPLRRMPLPSETLRIPTGDKVTDLREEWMAACLAYDERRAEQVLTQAFAIYPPEVVVLEIIQDGIAEIGRRWYAGDATVQQEHFASQLAMRRLEVLLSNAPAPTRRGRVLVACPPGEEHAIGPVIFALLLRRSGWDVVYLGADVPLEKMEETVDATGPDLVVLAAQRLQTAGDVREMAELLTRKGVSVAFGGGVFTRVRELRERVPGYFLGKTLREAVEATEQLIVKAAQAPGVEGPSRRYQEALSHYLERELAVEAQVLGAVGALAFDRGPLDEVRTQFADALVAALRLGDMDFLSDHIDWVRGRNGRGPAEAEALHRVMEIYYQVAGDQLDERGDLIVDWLRERLGALGKPGAESG